MHRLRLARVVVTLATIAALMAPALRVRAQSPATLTILHFNDIYEIDALGNGRFGGLARVATVIDELKHSSTALLTTLAGDYLAPSALGTARVNGEPLAGKQMVAVLNAIGLDWATLGNHEFDVSEAAFRAHITQASFHLVDSNVLDANDKPFPGIAQSAIVPIRIGDRDVRIGLIGLTIDSTKKPWVHYTEPIGAARTQVAALKGKVDAIIALTHLTLASDREVAIAVPDIDLILGGHEHENWLMRRGDHFTPVIKADANVRTVAIVSMTFGASGTRPTIDAKLREIDDRIQPKPSVQAEVERWTSLAFDAFRKDGFSPERVIVTTTAPLDGREASVRHGSTALTQLITSAMMHDAKTADLAITNSGSIRIDDVLAPGPIREYDVIRVLPFGGKTLLASMDGSLIAQVLDTGVKNEGNGGYLQTANVTRDASGAFLIQGKPIDPAKRYSVAIADYLLTGLEANLAYLTDKNPGVHGTSELRDIRQAVIDELKRQ